MTGKVPLTTLRQQAESGFVWDYAGTFIGMGSSFVIGVILARLLDPRDFGLIAMVTVFIGLVQGFMDFGLSDALVQRSETKAEHFTSAFVVNAGLGVALAALTFVTAPWIARFYGEPKITLIARVLGSVFVLRALALVHQAWLRKALKFATLTKIRLVSSLSGGCTGIVIALGGWGVWSLVAQSLGSAAVSVVALWTVSGWRIGGGVSLSALRDLWGYGFPMFVASLVNTVVTRIDVLVIGRLFSPADLGFFTRAREFVKLTARLSSESVGRVLFPVLSTIQDEAERFRRVSLQTLALVSFAAFFLSGWLFAVASPLVLILLTDKWLETAPMLRLFCLSAYVLPVNTVVLSMLKGLGRSMPFLRLEVLKKTLYLLALIIGFRFGIDGYLVALAVVGVINTGLNMRASSKAVGLGFAALPTAVAPYALAAAVAAGAVVAVGARFSAGVGMELAGGTAVFAAVYLAITVGIRTEGARLAADTLGRFLRRGGR